MAEVNESKSLSRDTLIKLMNKQNFTNAEKQIILFTH